MGAEKVQVVKQRYVISTITAILRNTDDRDVIKFKDVYRLSLNEIDNIKDII